VTSSALPTTTTERKFIEWEKTERAMTRPSSSVTVRQTSAGPAAAPSMREAGEPCTYTTSPRRAYMVGITNGVPSTTKPRWQISPSSRMARIVSPS
jgi:hypothetical protein